MASRWSPRSAFAESEIAFARWPSLTSPAAGVGLMYVGLLVLLAAGIVAGFMGDHWGRVWIWAALAIARASSSS